MTTITRDEWMAELERVMGKPRKGDPGRTSMEIAAASGMSQANVAFRLRLAHRLGLVRAGKKPITSMDGRNVWVPCYQLVTPPKAAKKR